MIEGDTPHEIRNHMLQLGWGSDDRFETHGWGEGNYGYSIWFSRWNWHGKRCDRITFHSALQNPLPKDIVNVVREAAERADRAWRDFPRSIPYQDVFGKVAVDPNLTRIVFEEAE